MGTECVRIIRDGNEKISLMDWPLIETYYDPTAKLGQYCWLLLIINKNE